MSHIKILILIVSCTIFASAATSSSSEEIDDDDWFNSIEDEGNNGTSVDNKSAAQKQIRWDRQSLCSHDPVTSIILKLILDAQLKMQKGDNSTGLMPLDPLRIPELVMGEERERSDGSVRPPPISANLEDIYIQNLSKFNITGITADLSKMFINISLFMETASITGTGRLKIGPIKLPVFGKGTFSFRLEGLDAFLACSFASHPNGTNYLKEFDYGFTMKKLYIDFTPPHRVGGLFRNPLLTPSGPLASLRATIFNRLEDRLHSRLQKRGADEISKRMGKWKIREEIMEEMLNHSVYCYFG